MSILPVGFNLQDHAEVAMPLIEVSDPTVIKYDNANLQFKDFNEFVDSGTGNISKRKITDDFGRRII